MTNHYGETPAREVNQTVVQVDTSQWIALQVGSAPQNNRRHVEVFPKSVVGGALGLAYANGVVTNNNRGVSSTAFTTPTDIVGNVALIPGGTLHAIPLGDNVTLYGRLINKAGATLGSVRVVVTEFS